jgi:3'-phosphoadenosine 5'-phosphosulfate sulfotransferase (PAPS reductase)/FAD synthetase
MKHVVCFSGGKDSTALVLWAKENLAEFTTVFCDTGWEHPITYAYVEEINQTVLGGKLVTLKSEKYPNGMRQLVQIKGMIPQNSGRFCTVELKVIPTQQFLSSIDDDDFCLYDGKRCDESDERSNLQAQEWADIYDCYVYHPLRHFSAQDCFDLCERHGVKPNPLYMRGASRVGCFPCINLNLGDLKRMSPLVPDLRPRIKELERFAGRSFFGPSFIPERFQTGFDAQSGKKFPTSDDVFRYIDSVDENQIPMFPARSCMSVYNLCE